MVSVHDAALWSCSCVVFRDVVVDDGVVVGSITPTRGG